MNTEPNITVEAAINRFFRKYSHLCKCPDEDTLFDYLAALHSLNDKLRKNQFGDLFHSDRFHALKAMRNLFHHQEELIHEIKIIPNQDLPPLSIELMYVCLIDSGLVDKACETKYAEERRVKSAFKWYGEVADIQPCLFNCTVEVFEHLQGQGLETQSPEFQEFVNSYRFEEENGYSHYVEGNIFCPAGSVTEVLKKVFH